ncbi:prickle [Sarotherodon galilaeus]
MFTLNISCAAELSSRKLSTSFHAMEEIYVNTEHLKCVNPTHSMNRTGERSTKKSLYLVIILCLSLLSVFLLAGLVTLGFLYRDSSELLSAMNNQFSSMSEERDPLNANVSAMIDQIFSMTEERDLLQADLTEKTKELERLQSLFNQKKTCPTGWKMFSGVCYFLSGTSGIWDEARRDCRDKGADLVVIESPEEQNFLTTIINDNTWIGLTDNGMEGQWKWVDGTPLTLANWATNEPNNGGSLTSEEDCVHIRAEDQRTWNDISCTASMKWICKEIP